MSVEAAVRAGLADPVVAGLTGRFHAHVTVVGAVGAAADVSAALGGHLTVIDLAPREQRDGMVTLDHVGPLPAFEVRLVEAVAALRAAGLDVVRVKVEHGSLPTLPRFTRARYREVHVKLRIARADFADAHARLLAAAPTHGYALSTNPREQTPEAVVQFVNLRIYDGDLAAADARVAALVAWLSGEGLAPIEVRHETAVLDTRHEVDAWWA